MIREFSKRFIKFITEENYSVDECEQMEYVLNSIIFELLKMGSIIFIYTLFGYFKEILVIITTTNLTKPFIGGYHEKTQFRCFIASMLFTAGELLLSIQCNLSFWCNCIIIMLCLFCIYNNAPVINSKMPITRLQLIKKNRNKGLVNSIILGLVSIIIHNYSNYYALITWTLLINVTLMFNKREKGRG